MEEGMYTMDAIATSRISSNCLKDAGVLDSDNE